MRTTPAMLTWKSRLMSNSSTGDVRDAHRDQDERSDGPNDEQSEVLAEKKGKSIH